MKVFGALAGIFLVIVVILSLLTALTSASASLANGVANAAASTALLTSQCLSGFMVVVALIAGAGVGVTTYRFVSGRQARQLPTPPAAPAPYPVIRMQDPQPNRYYLPAGNQRLPVIYTQEKAPADEADSQDILFRNWGW
ncbi:MAG TPA: hypothetical protein PKG95_15805 [Anaerolineaceae bacterium]|nr:hypothetical protein [Anaerolineaceae bacterium]